MLRLFGHSTTIPTSPRHDLGRRLMAVGDEIEIVPMRTLAFRMAELADSYALSTLGAEYRVLDA